MQLLLLVQLAPYVWLVLLKQTHCGLWGGSSPDRVDLILTRRLFYTQSARAEGLNTQPERLQ